MIKKYSFLIISLYLSTIWANSPCFAYDPEMPPSVEQKIREDYHDKAHTADASGRKLILIEHDQAFKFKAGIKEFAVQPLCMFPIMAHENA